MYFCVHICTSPSTAVACSNNNNQAQLLTLAASNVFLHDSVTALRVLDTPAGVCDVHSTLHINIV